MGRLGETTDLIDGPIYQNMRAEQNDAYRELVNAITSQ